MAKQHVNVRFEGLEPMRQALAETEATFSRAVQRQLRKALAPPAAGKVRVRISADLDEALFADDAALGAHLVKLARRGRR